MELLPSHSCQCHPARCCSPSLQIPFIIRFPQAWPAVLDSGAAGGCGAPPDPPPASAHCPLHEGLHARHISCVPDGNLGPELVVVTRVGRRSDSSVSLVCRRFKFSHAEEISESSHMIHGYGSHRFEEESLLSALPQAQGTISLVQHINSINHGVVWLQSGRVVLLQRCSAGSISVLPLKESSDLPPRNGVPLALVHPFPLLLLGHPRVWSISSQFTSLGLVLSA